MDPCYFWSLCLLRQCRWPTTGIPLYTNTTLEKKIYLSSVKICCSYIFWVRKRIIHLTSLSWSNSMFVLCWMKVMTNGRFMSVKHRAVNDPSKSRLSFGYFSGPPLHAKITALPEFITPDQPCLYKPFTWAEFKKTAYSLRLKESRLKFYQLSSNDDQQW